MCSFSSRIMVRPSGSLNPLVLLRVIYSLLRTIERKLQRSAHFIKALSFLESSFFRHLFCRSSASTLPLSITTRLSSYRVLPISSMIWVVLSIFLELPIILELGENPEGYIWCNSYVEEILCNWEEFYPRLLPWGEDSFALNPKVVWGLLPASPLIGLSAMVARVL